MTLFQFKPDWFIDGRNQPIAIKASREWIEQFIQIDEFGTLFGGYVVWRKPSQPVQDMPGEAIGVWGNRNVSRLRRILRERGAEYHVILDEGPKQTLKIQSTSH